MVRYESSVTSISWIPSEAMTGPLRLPVDLGVGHYDVPPPNQFESLEDLRDEDRFRFANHLSAFIEVEDGSVKAMGYLGGGVIGATNVNLGTRTVKIPAVAFADIQRPPEVTAEGVCFVQTAGGRTGAPLPRRISRPPFLQLTAPTAWTTLAITIGLDGRSSFDLVGASPFPRHWIYGPDRVLAQKSGVIDFAGWAAENTHDRSPWFDHDQTTPVAEAETAIEQAISAEIMGGSKPTLRRYRPGETVLQQGAQGRELMLILDGMATVLVDGEAVAEAGPGSVLGERAALEGGTRTASIHALTPILVAVSEAVDVDSDTLETLSQMHRREGTTL
jgi:hypothetical protein